MSSALPSPTPTARAVAPLAGLAALVLLLGAAACDDPLLAAPPAPGPAYSRIRASDALGHEHRLRIVEILRQRGPQRLSALARELGLDRTSLEHHARVLERTQHAAVTRAGGFVLIHLPGQEPRLPREPAVGPAAERILVELARHGGEMPRSLVHSLLPDVRRRTRTDAVRALVVRGWVRREWDGKVDMLRLAGARRREDPDG